MGFYGDLMGFYGDLMGFYGDINPIGSMVLEYWHLLIGIILNSYLGSM